MTLVTCHNLPCDKFVGKIIILFLFLYHFSWLYITHIDFQNYGPFKLKGKMSNIEQNKFSLKLNIFLHSSILFYSALFFSTSIQTLNFPTL